ncbi:hypothetical protein [Nocardioides sp.]|uniref:hypothetical protein n=1 Tax=Nocardioides sp. TaxID=35761 RepID=UPI0027204220|nr:hypothetical protein [Nocardioides sp.]MDO9454543.1 hypothetical protein [Nocardioides sp.]
MARRPLRLVLASTLVVGVLAGCSDVSGEPDEGAGTPEPTPAPTSATSATDGVTDPTDLADPAAYLPTPEGVELTEPGTELTFRQPALAAWKPRQDVVGVVDVRVDRVERTTVKKSLVGFQLDAAGAASTPYFVSTEVTNDGDTDLGERQLPLYVVDSEERLIPPTGIDPAFAPCPGSTLPAIFAPDDEARSCLIFLVPAGAELVSVMFRPPEGVVPITWTGTVTDLGARGGKKGGPRTPGATATPSRR